MNLLTNREYLGLTVPFMLSTMTQPLMGAVNTAVMGQLPDPKYIAAVSLGAILFNNLYWLFGFLRVSTTGYAALLQYQIQGDGLVRQIIQILTRTCVDRL